MNTDLQAMKNHQTIVEGKKAAQAWLSYMPHFKLIVKLTDRAKHCHVEGMNSILTTTGFIDWFVS
jgi:hypothetical protein